MTFRPKAPLPVSCPHSWIPARRYPQYGICFYCGARGRWSTVLGCYIRIIPESHTRDGQVKRYERPRT